MIDRYNPVASTPIFSQMLDILILSKLNYFSWTKYFKKIQVILSFLFIISSGVTYLFTVRHYS